MAFHDAKAVFADMLLCVPKPIIGVLGVRDSMDSHRSLWSLWDMLNLVVGALYQQLISLELLKQQAELIHERGVVAEKGEAYFANVLQHLASLKQSCIELELGESKKNVERIERKISSRIKIELMPSEIGCLLELLESECSERLTYNIKKDKSATFAQEDKAWAPIDSKFKSIREDVESGLHCYALDQDTASIFHFMRVVEIGLRSLARERNVKIPKKHLDWQQWRTIINAISRKVDLIDSWKAGPAKDNALDFYRGAIGEFQAFKDVYRNHVMHTHGSYDSRESLRVLQHVRGFMERLSSKIEENPKNSIKWGRK